MRWLFAAIATLLLFPLAGESWGQSSGQPPIPSVDGAPPEKQHKRTEESEQKTQELKQAPGNLPPTINVILSGEVTTKSSEPKTEGERQHNDWWDRFVAWAWDTKFSEALLVLFTAILAGVTLLLAFIALLQKRAFVATERAYVKISHTPKTLIDVLNGVALVEMQITNNGRTPAEVTDVVINFVGGINLPEIPPVEPEINHRPDRVFLVTQDFFFHRRRLDVRLLNSEDGPRKLWLIGCVNYIDRFMRAYQAGYAREYDLSTRDLVFVTQHGYNYDRRIRWWERWCKRGRSHKI